MYSDAPYGEIVPINAILLAYQEKTLKGSYDGSARTALDMPLIVQLAQIGKIELDALVARRYPLENINDACADLDCGEPGRGLVVFAS